MAPEETAAATEAAAPKKNKKMLLLGLIGGFVLLAAVNGVLAWKVLSKGTPAATAPAGPVAETPEEEDDDTLLYELDPFIVNLFDEHGIRYLKVRLDIEVEDYTEQQLEKKVPKIRDSLIVLLSSKKYEEIGSLEGKARLREEILYRLNRILGEGRAKEVYFTDFVVQ